MKIVSLMLVLAVLSCGKKSDESTKPRGEIRAALLPQATPNQYFTSVDWTIPVGTGERFLARQREGHRAILCDLERCPKPYLDVAVAAGETLSYAILEGEDVLAETTFLAPKDFVVEGVQRLESLPPLSEFRRLFLGKGTHLVTNGAAVLALDEIIADDAVIETFAENDVAVSGAGRAAGKLIVKAKTATGKLTVISRGEKGSKGLPGISGVQGLIGKIGMSGEIWDCRNWAPGIYCEANLAMAGSVPQGHPWFRNVYQCKTKSLDGLEGADGGAGYPGGQGSAGGDAGLLRVEIENPTSLVLTVSQLGGSGGDGGDGGLGGAGGLGGQPGGLDIHKVCSPGKQGSQGRQGPAGPVGNVGNIGGADFPKCVITGFKREGTCD